MSVVNWTGKYLIADRMAAYSGSIGSMAKVRKCLTYTNKGSVEFLMGLTGASDAFPAAEIVGSTMFGDMFTLSKLAPRFGFCVIYVFKTDDLRKYCTRESITKGIGGAEEYTVVRIDDDVTDKASDCTLLPKVLSSDDATSSGSGGDYYRIAESMGRKPKEILLAMAEGNAPSCGRGWDIVRFGGVVKKHDHVQLNSIEDIVKMKEKFLNKANRVSQRQGATDGKK